MGLIRIKSQRSGRRHNCRSGKQMPDHSTDQLHSQLRGPVPAGRYILPCLMKHHTIISGSGKLLNIEKVPAFSIPEECHDAKRCWLIPATIRIESSVIINLHTHDKSIRSLSTFSSSPRYSGSGFSVSSLSWMFI